MTYDHDLARDVDLTDAVRPAWWLLLTAVGVAAVSLGSLAALSGRTGDWLGYAGALASLLMIVVFRFANQARQMRAQYEPDPRLAPVAGVTVLVALISLIWGAVRIATTVPA